MFFVSCLLQSLYYAPEEILCFVDCLEAAVQDKAHSHNRARQYIWMCDDMQEIIRRILNASSVSSSTYPRLLESRALP